MQASQLELEQRALDTTGLTGHLESALSVHARLWTLLLFHYTRTHTDVQNLERTLKTNFSKPRLLEFLWIIVFYFWITGAWLNRASDLMFNAWRTAATATAAAAVLFLHLRASRNHARDQKRRPLLLVVVGEGDVR